MCEIAPSCNIRWLVLANLSLPSKPHFSFQRISCNLQKTSINSVHRSCFLLAILLLPEVPNFYVIYIKSFVLTKTFIVFEELICK